MAKILIIGTGGVGTIAGLSLTQHGNEVTFVVRSNFEELKKTGYNIESCDHGDQTNWKPHRMVNSVQEAIANDKNYDYVLVAMKALPDVFSTADIIRPVVESSPNVAIVLFQNGLNIEEPIVKAFPNNVCVSGVSMIGSTNLGAGEIHQAEPDYVKIGYFDNGSDKAPRRSEPRNLSRLMDPSLLTTSTMWSTTDGESCCTTLPSTPSVPLHEWTQVDCGSMECLILLSDLQWARFELLPRQMDTF